MSTDRSLRVGVVVARTGRLAALADPLVFCAERLVAPLGDAAARAGGRRVELVWRDSRSDPAVATRAVRELAADPRVVLVVTMAGTQLVPAIARAAQAAGLPCLSTGLPWQAYRAALPELSDSQERQRWGWHFCWGLGDIGRVFAQLWRLVERVRPDGSTASRVGCLWNHGRQGQLLRRDDPTGFLAAAAAAGFRVHDPGGYPEGAADFEPHIQRLRAAGVTMVTSAATPADLGRFRTQAATAGWVPALVTCSRWLAYPSSVHPHDSGVTTGAHAAAHAPATNVNATNVNATNVNIATLVYWTPAHPYASSLDATTPRVLAQQYQRQTGRAWLQPLGLAHALLEVAAHALRGCADRTDPADRAAVAHALSSTSLDTLAGRLDWTTGPAPGIAGVHLVGGQWQRRKDAHELVVLTNTGLPELPVTGALAGLDRAGE